MNATFSATKSQKSGTSANPFDQITEMEKREAERVQKEILAMESEKEEVTKAVSEKQTKAEEELKDQAREELKEYKESDLSQILKKSEKTAEKSCEALESAYNQHSTQATAELVSTMTQSDSPLFE